MSNDKPTRRQRARRLVLQALFQWQFSAAQLDEIELQFHTFNNMMKVDSAYFHELFHQIAANLDVVDNHFQSYLDRDITDLNAVELQILRIGTYELSECPDVPYRVVINEAVELAKCFSEKDAYKFINGVLDEVVKNKETKK